MLLHIETIKRVKYTHAFLPSTTVAEIKQYIQDVWKLGTVESQKLIHCGSILTDDTSSIQSLNIPAGSTLILFVRASKPKTVGILMQQQLQQQQPLDQSAASSAAAQNSNFDAEQQAISPAAAAEERAAQSDMDMSINHLVAMGFDRVTSSAVLEVTHGNVVAATEMLLGDNNAASPPRRRRRRTAPVRASAAAANVMIDNVLAARNSANPAENLASMSGVAPEVLAQLREIIQNDPTFIERTLNSHMSSDPTNFNRLRSNPLAITLLQAGLNVEAGGDALAQIASGVTQDENGEDEHDEDYEEDPEYATVLDRNGSQFHAEHNEEEEGDEEEEEDEEYADAAVFTHEDEAVVAVRALGMQMPEDQIREAYRRVGPRVDDIVSALLENRDGNVMRDD